MGGLHIFACGNMRVRVLAVFKDMVYPTRGKLNIQTGELEFRIGGRIYRAMVEKGHIAMAEKAKPEEKVEFKPNPGVKLLKLVKPPTIPFFGTNRLEPFVVVDLEHGKSLSPRLEGKVSDETLRKYITRLNYFTRWRFWDAFFKSKRIDIVQALLFMAAGGFITFLGMYLFHAM